MRRRVMGLGLKMLNRLAGSKTVDRFGLRKPIERAFFRASKSGFRTAGAVGRSFKASAKPGKAARLAPAQRTSLFDLTPTDEQQMLREAAQRFGAEQLRPAAAAANDALAAPAELLQGSSDLGLTLLGVPEELGGAGTERSAVTNALVAEALAHGDMGLALACLAPSAVSSALVLWGDETQQATYLPEFVKAGAPAAALAVLERQALFDPWHLSTRAKPAESGWRLSGVKSLVPRAAQAELFIVAADIEGRGPGLFVIESSTPGLSIAAEPAMGLRAASLGRLVLDNVALPKTALLAGGSADAYAQCIQLARLGWCALAVGTAQAVLDYVVPYVNGRIAFGEPISHRQAVAFAVANIGIELEGMRLTTWRAASRAEAGEPFAREAALARRLCADKGMQIGADGVQLLGGHGFVKEHPVERWYRDLRAVGLMEGAILI